MMCMKKKIKLPNYTYSCIVERNIHGSHVPGKGNCLVRNPIGFEAVNCFYGSFGYICETRGELNL